MKARAATKKLFRPVLWLLAAQAAGVLFSVACAGCASPGYFGHRARDAADIFTATVGLGAGIKGRVGPLQVGALYNIDMHGLRGGQWGETIWYETHTRDMAVPFPVRTAHFEPKLYPWDYPGWCFGHERWQAVAASPKHTFARRKAYEAVSPVPFVSLANSPAYYTQLEVVLAAGGSLRLGFNPGELLDFLLGWTTLDIFGDDVAAPPSGQSTSAALTDRREASVR